MICNIFEKQKQKRKKTAYLFNTYETLMKAEKVQSSTLICQILINKGLELLPDTIAFITPSVQ